MSEIEAAPPRRVEIFTGADRRRSWTAEEKASIVAESYEEGVHACQVARRHGLTPRQLFTWRRAARESLKAVDAETPSAFVPAVVEATAAKATPAEPTDAQAASVRPPSWLFLRAHVTQKICGNRGNGGGVRGGRFRARFARFGRFVEFAGAWRRNGREASGPRG